MQRYKEFEEFEELDETFLDESLDVGEASEIDSLEDILTQTDSEPYFEKDPGFDVESYREIKITERDKEIPNQDLRLINAYFKEVSTEPLLTPREEVEVAAKIKECEMRAKKMQRAVEKIMGGGLGCDTKKTLLELKEAADKGSTGRIEVNKGRVKKLISLIEAYSEKANQFRNRFIKANLRLVASIAKKYVGRGVPFLDLIQEGNLGLIKAVERFDHTKGYRFSTYACWWINQAITRALYSQTRTIRVPSYVFEKSGKVRYARSLLKERTGRTPNAEEIAKKVNMSVESVKRVLETGEKVLSLDATVWADEKVTYMDFIPDSGSLPPDSLMAANSLPKNVNDALLTLSPREREVIKMRFGIGYNSPSTLDEVGKRFGLTRERIRQIERRALERLRRSKSAPALKSLVEFCN